MTHAPSSRGRAGATAVLLLALAACEATTAYTPPAGAVLSVYAGNAQTGPVGAALPVPLAALVADSQGAPLAGVRLTWTITSGGGSVANVTTSGPDGVATAVYSAGTTAGPKAIVALVEGVAGPSAAFSATAMPGPATRLVKSGGDLQSALAGSPLALPLEVTVSDQFANPVAGVQVAWAVPTGNATASPPSSATDSLGVARTTITTAAGAAPGVVVTASVGGLTGSPVSFTASAVLVSLVRSVPIPDNYGIHDQFLRDGLAFVCAWNTGLLIYDVGNGMSGGTPANPVLVSSIVTSENGVNGARVHNAWWFHNPVTSEKRYVFIGQEGPAVGGIGAGSSGDIHVVDVADLRNPVEVAFFHMQPVNGSPAGTHNFWMDEAAQVLYAAYYNGGVVALDVSGTLSGDLAAREIARIRPGGNGNTYIWGVQLFNGSLYATDMLSGFWQLRLTGTTFSVAGGGTNVPDRFGSDQWVHGGYAYSGTWGSRAGRPGNAVKIWQLGATGAPALVDSIITPNIGTVSDVEVSADGKLLMFSAEGGPGSGVYFYSLVADPARPVFVAFYAVPAGVHTTTFATIGGRRYVFAAKDPSNAALLILDATGLVQ